jgi:mono/diheme cytochrome c family protein
MAASLAALLLSVACEGFLMDSPAAGLQHGPYAPPPEGSVPLGGPAPQSDEDELQDAMNPAQQGRLTLVRGRELYVIHCSPCHGDTGRGDGPVAAVLSEKTPDLTDAKVQTELTDGGMVHVIATGTMSEVMPSFSADIALEDRWILVRYLRSIAQGAPPP